MWHTWVHCCPWLFGGFHGFAGGGFRLVGTCMFDVAPAAASASATRCCSNFTVCTVCTLLAWVAGKLSMPALPLASTQTVGAEGHADRSRLQQLAADLEEARRREQVGLVSIFSIASASFLCSLVCFGRQIGQLCSTADLIA